MPCQRPFGLRKRRLDLSFPQKTNCVLDRKIFWVLHGQPIAWENLRKRERRSWGCRRLRTTAQRRKAGHLFRSKLLILINVTPNHPGPESIDKIHIAQVRNCRLSHRKDRIQHYCMSLLPSLRFWNLDGRKLVSCAARFPRAFQSGDRSHSLKIVTNPSRHSICSRRLAFLAFHKQWRSSQDVTDSGG